MKCASFGVVTQAAFIFFFVPQVLFQRPTAQCAKQNAITEQHIAARAPAVVSVVSWVSSLGALALEASDGELLLVVDAPLLVADVAAAVVESVYQRQSV